MTNLPVGTPGGQAPCQKPPPDQQHALLRILGLACFGSSLGVFLFDPVLPMLSRDFAVPRSQVVAMATAFALAYALAQPIAGALGDQLGKLRVMRVCLGVSALGTLLGSLASSFELLLATRLVVGFFTAGTFPLCFAILAERIAPEGHQEAFGKASAASVTGSLAGAVGSGFIADALGWRGSLLVAGLIGLSCFAIVTAALRDTREVSSSRAGFGSAFSAYRRILGLASARRDLGLQLALTGLTQGLFPHIAFLVGASASTVGIVLSGFMIGSIAYGVSLRRTLRWITPVHFTLAGGLVMALAMASLSAHLPWPLQFGALLAFGFALSQCSHSTSDLSGDADPAYAGRDDGVALDGGHARAVGHAADLCGRVRQGRHHADPACLGMSARPLRRGGRLNHAFQQTLPLNRIVGGARDDASSAAQIEAFRTVMMTGSRSAAISRRS
ncbi:MFS transporter [Bosea sp. 2YAB26]|uniref:MFS transporter n=1 Tax=Bosea sp. 2YAB26 TaxID=3237478 RepID=UPI003F93578A